MDYNNNNNYNGYNNYNNYNNGQYNEQQPAGAYQYAYTPQEPVNKKGNGAAIASLVLGIISLVCCGCCGMGFLFGVSAIVFAIVSGKKKGKIQGIAIAGLVCGIIGAVMGFACDMSFWLFGGGLQAFFEGAADAWNDNFY